MIKGIYYQKLKIVDRIAYLQLKNALFNHNSSVNLYFSSKINKIFEYLKNDYPQLFYVEDFLIYDYGIKKKLKFRYRYDKQETIFIQNECNRFLKKNFNKNSSLNAWDQLLYIHDWFCKNITYKENGYRSHSIVGPLLDSYGVCEGISEFVKIILDYLNIKCVIVKGISKQENHAWNKVCIDNKWYNLDVTFDITLSNGDLARHDYFLLTDIDILKDHAENECLSLKCTDNSLNYYYKNNLLINSKQDYKNLLLKFLYKNILHFEFKIPSAKQSDKVDKTILKLSSEVLQLKKGCFNIFVNSNFSQLVFAVKIISENK